VIPFVVVGFSALFVVVKLFERRLGKAIVRTGIAFLLVVPLMGVAYAAWTLSRRWVAPVDLELLAAFAIITGLGTSFGYHRLLTHRSFETHAPIKALALIAGAMAVPSRPIDWAARHLEHHAHADREGDPHSPLDGFLHAHVGWIFAVEPAPRERYCRRLLEDRLVVAVDRTAEFWFFSGLIIPALIDGWRGLVWGGLVRIAVHNQTMFAVNSVCHRLGSRDFDTRDSSRNNLLVSLLSFGEGWHNNHHAFPSMAIHGIGPGQPDPTGLLIRLLDRVGLIWDVNRPPPDLIARRRTVARDSFEGAA
jgi:stearoyl-CoA desaturase (Delta-9 desaturase)